MSTLELYYNCLTPLSKYEYSGVILQSLNSAIKIFLLVLFFVTNIIAFSLSVRQTKKLRFHLNLTFPVTVATKTKMLLFYSVEQDYLVHCSIFPYQICPSKFWLTALCSRYVTVVFWGFYVKVHFIVCYVWYSASVPLY
jgi:hypothetical protein